MPMVNILRPAGKMAAAPSDDDIKKHLKYEIDYHLVCLLTYIEAPRKESFTMTLEDALKSGEPSNLKYVSKSDKMKYIKKLQDDLYKKIDEKIQ
jgi:hypothetical protein